MQDDAIATIDKIKLLNWLKSAPQEISADELLRWVEGQINSFRT